MSSIPGIDGDPFAPEPLDPELEYYRRGRGPFEGVFHPLIYAYPYWGAENKTLNLRFAHKKRKCDEALAAGKWSSYLALHEKPYRVNALMEIRDLITDHAVYWELVAETWQYTENLYETRRYWAELWHSQRPGRYEHAMDDDDRQRLDQLDGGIVIYRGSTNRAGIKGMSWTLDFDVAYRLASRVGISAHYGPLVYVARGIITKRRVLAFFGGRSEDEIVVVPRHVRGLSVTAYPRKSMRRS